MRIKMPAVRIAQADSDTTEPEGAQDILTCGSCQKTFSLSDIVRFIQHKVLQCNKENYGQCFQQQGGGTSDDRESDDGRPLSLVNTRRPTISAPITARKPSASRVHTPPQTSPAELLGDGASSTPKSLADENEKQLDTQTTQERMDMSSSHDEENSVSSGRPLNKKLRTEVADAESNTTHSEPSNYVCSTCKSRFHSAWRLVQHVQHSHGVKIYLESGGTSASTSASSGSSSGNGNSAALLASNSLNVLTQNHQTSASSSSTSSASMKQLKDLSGSSTCSSSTSENSNRDRSLSAAVAAAAAAAASQNSMVVAQNLPPPGLRHHPLLPPHDLHTNPFGLLRMPMPPLSQGPAPPVPPLFSRPHPDHFRMEQLVSEQFRHHGLNLAAAAAVAAANSMSNHNQNFGGGGGGGGGGVGNTISSNERPPSSGGRSISSLPPSNQSLGIEPQMDFYSQRLRQLAGTTSPGAGISNAAAANTSSPSPRKQQSPPFASPSPSQLPPTPLTVSNSRPQSMTPPEKMASDLINNGGDGATITNTPRSSSTPPSKQIQANEAVHSCEFCGKKFRFQSNLVVHRRAHTGEKPYKCNQCDFACAQNSKLRHHMKIHQTPEDRASNSGSVETLDGDESPEDLEEDEDELGMDEEEDMDDNDFDEGKMEDEAEDLRMSNTKDAIKELGRELGMHSNHHSSASLVGELMDKFGLSNIAQYSEAYKQALQESGNALKLHLSNKDRDNNNSSHLPFPDKLNGLPAALRLREEFAKNMLHQQHQAQSQVPLFHPFDNPFIDQTKRMKLEAYEVSKRIKFEGADSWWNLASGLHRNDAVLFDDLKPKHNVPNAAGQMMQNPMKKEQKRNDTCEFCGKVFKNCSNLTVHRRSHTGEKPYKCELCSYACAQSSKLTRHMKTHGRMGKDVYRCRFCDMPFSVPSTLEKHMRKCVVNQGGGGKQVAHQSSGLGGLGQNGQTQQTILNNNNNNLSNNNNVNLNNINSNSLSNLSNSSNNNNNNNNNSSIPNIQLGSNPNSLMGSNGLNLSGLVGACNNGLQIPQMPLIKNEDDNSSIMNIKKETA